ncbi:hypothetical protein PR202_ga03139 [Eleusine coracana subsp. coracana]|uniref:F-box domain-containing protein n=1 Tax=Eleusine coracana subsp. coracana TaxID=191504 RepID=A0AAV5BP69_ELECO|nr:hypothetical protein PR202_ga03139 [Eleusine coracana subsp. coracana]
MDGVAEIFRLPEECVAYAISLTTPGDACHSSAVSPAFKAAADSDAVWTRFLPPDCAAVLARADEPVDCESKKELFSRLCDSPVLLDGATMAKLTVVVVSGSGGNSNKTSTEHAVCLQHMHGEEETAVHRRKQQYMRLRRGYGYGGRKTMMVTREADPDIRCPRRRPDGWAEVELGVFAVGDGEDGVVEVSFTEVDSQRWKRGLIVQGIEIRPKHTS